MPRILSFRSAPVATLTLGGCDVALDAPIAPVGPSATTPTVAAMFELIGGYRLGMEYASEGLAVVPDAQGFAQAIVGGDHAHQRSVHLYELPSAPGLDSRHVPGSPAELDVSSSAGLAVRPVALVRAPVRS